MSNIPPYIPIYEPEKKALSGCIRLADYRIQRGFTKESGGFRGESLGNREISATALPNDYFQHTRQSFCILLWYFRCARPEVQHELYFGQYFPPSQILRRGFVKREVQSVTAVQCLSCLDGRCPAVATSGVRQAYLERMLSCSPAKIWNLVQNAVDGCRMIQT